MVPSAEPEKLSGGRATRSARSRRIAGRRPNELFGQAPSLAPSLPEPVIEHFAKSGDE
jgi:hypothetical protein